MPAPAWPKALIGALSSNSPTMRGAPCFPASATRARAGRRPACVGEFQPPAATAEQRDAETLLEGPELAGQGLGREMELFRRAVDGAGFRDGAEIIQMPVIEHDGTRIVEIEL
jgi:hypothetical protein